MIIIEVLLRYNLRYFQAIQLLCHNIWEKKTYREVRFNSLILYNNTNLE